MQLFKYHTNLSLFTEWILYTVMREAAPASFPKCERMPPGLTISSGDAVIVET